MDLCTNVKDSISETFCLIVTDFGTEVMIVTVFGTEVIPIYSLFHFEFLLTWSNVKVNVPTFIKTFSTFFALELQKL